MAFGVVLDANVLFPAALRNVLLDAAEHNLYQLRLTKAILSEVKAGVLRIYPDANMDRTIQLIEESFGDTFVEGYESIIPSMTNDEDDRHVLAAAVCSGAQMIVSDNVKDFPATSCSPYNIEVNTADEFLLDLWDLHADAMMRILNEEASRTAKPNLDVRGVLAALRKSVPGFVAVVERSPLLED